MQLLPEVTDENNHVSLLISYHCNELFLAVFQFSYSYPDRRQFGSRDSIKFAAILCSCLHINTYFVLQSLLVCSLHL
jgi:hypothetical protein